jgi:5-(carboxyamino)imidazole ribonucleotide mutase
MLAVDNPDMRLKLEAFRRDQTEAARAMVLPITGSAA